jgi:hypothetical protein
MPFASRSGRHTPPSSATTESKSAVDNADDSAETGRTST